MKKFIFWGFYFLVLAKPALTKELTPLEVFRRCYNQITSLSLSREQPEYIKLNSLVNPTIEDAIHACMAVIDRASLTSKNELELHGDKGDREKKETLKTFDNIHRALFFPVDNFDLSLSSYCQNNSDFLDSTEPYGGPL